MEFDELFEMSDVVLFYCFLNDVMYYLIGV